MTSKTVKILAIVVRLDRFFLIEKCLLFNNTVVSAVVPNHYLIDMLFYVLRVDIYIYLHCIYIACI